MKNYRFHFSQFEMLTFAISTPLVFAELMTPPLYIRSDKIIMVGRA